MTNDKKKPHWFTRTVLSDTKRIELVVCSVCKTEYSFDYETGVGANDYNFCPNCGAKMDKVGKPLCGKEG